MKKNKISVKIISVSLALALGVGTVFSLVSCKKEDKVITDTETVTDIITETFHTVTEPEVTETAAPETEDTSLLRTPVDNEKAAEFIKLKYEDAVKLIKSLPPYKESIPYNADKATFSDSDGNLYYKVEFSFIPTDGETSESGESAKDPFDAFTKYITSTFAPKYAEKLCSLAKEYYTTIENTLCFMPPETDYEVIELKKTDDKDREVISDEFFLSKFTDSLFRYTEKITYEKMSEDDTDNVVYIDYIFENTGDGWHFTSFPTLD